MNYTVSGVGSPGFVTSDWTVAETGDFNGDGKSDILWRNTSSGEIVIWLMDGMNVSGGGGGGWASSDWQIQAMKAD
jgi:hypothetical protein